MDEDQILQSIIADPKLTDPSIDVGQLRQTTPTRAELLADVPEFSGLKFDFTNRDYIRDLYSIYGGGLPTIPEPVVDTPVVNTPVIDTPVIDTPVDNVIGPTLPGFDVDSPKNTDFEQSLIDQGIGVQATPTDPVVAPGEMPLTQDDFDAFNQIAVTPQTFADTGRADLLDQAGNVPGVGFATDFFPDINTNVGTTKPTATFGDTTTGLEDYLEGIDPATGQAETPSVAFDRPTIADVAGPVTLSRQDVIDTDANVGFVDTPTLEAEDLDTSGNLLQSGIDKIRSVIPDFDPVKVGARLAFNTIIGKPVSLVFDLLEATGLEGGRGTFANELGDEYGMDDIGRLTSGPMAGYAPNSMFGDIVEAAQERIDNIENRTAPQTDASIKKVQELNDFIQKATSIKAKQTAPQEDIGSVSEDITTGVDPVTGDLPGGGNIVDEFAPSDIQPTDPSLEITDRGRGDGGGQDTGPSGPPSGPGEVSSDAGFAGEGSGAQGPAGGASNAAAAAAQDAARGNYGGPPSQSGGGGSSGGGGKIVCTMMNESYGFGSFRNKIWLRHSKGLAPEYQIGYHKIFLPLVRLSKTNKVLKKILEHVAVHRTIDIRQESRGKMHLLGRVYRKILEPICYWVGKHD